MDKIILTLLAVIIFLILFLAWSYGLYRMYRYKFVFYTFILAFIVLALWELTNYYKIMPDINDGTTWTKVILVLIVFIGPFIMGSQDSCKYCDSPKINEIDKIMIGLEKKTRTITRQHRSSQGNLQTTTETEHYSIKTYDIIMQCEDCNHSWMETRTKKE